MLVLVTAIVALLFAIWFGRAAERAGLGTFEWAIGGAALAAAVSIAVPVVVLVVVRKMAGEIAPTTTFLVGGGSWLLGILAAIVLGSRALPEPAQDQIRVVLAAQKAKAGSETSGESMSCVKCGRAIQKREALRLGAIRIDDKTCICPACKGR